MARSEKAKRREAKAVRHASNGATVIKTFCKKHPESAITLPEGYVREFATGNGSRGSLCSHTHASGWTISGEVKEDYFTWVNDFSASHPVYGNVWGNFEKKVMADTEEGFNNFVESHPPKYWDYGDI